MKYILYKNIIIPMVFKVYHGHLCNVELQACSTCKIRLKFVELRFPDCAAQQTRVIQQVQFGPRSVCLTG